MIFRSMRLDVCTSCGEKSNVFPILKKRDAPGLGFLRLNLGQKKSALVAEFPSA
jgi:hypothetical protein